MNKKDLNKIIEYLKIAVPFFNQNLEEYDGCHGELQVELNEIANECGILIEDDTQGDSLWSLTQYAGDIVNVITGTITDYDIRDRLVAILETNYLPTLEEIEKGIDIKGNTTYLEDDGVFGFLPERFSENKEIIDRVTKILHKIIEDRVPKFKEIIILQLSDESHGNSNTWGEPVEVEVSEEIADRYWKSFDIENEDYGYQEIINTLVEQGKLTHTNYLIWACLNKLIKTTE